MSGMHLTEKDRAILRWDGRKFSAYVCLESKYEAYIGGLEGQTAQDALNNALHAACMKRELGEGIEEIPTPAEFDQMMRDEVDAESRMPVRKV